jgi:hypothetical protein
MGEYRGDLAGEFCSFGHCEQLRSVTFELGSKLKLIAMRAFQGAFWLMSKTQGSGV